MVDRPTPGEPYCNGAGAAFAYAINSAIERTGSDGWTTSTLGANPIIPIGVSSFRGS
jgi:hypothetical protein